MLSPGKKVHYYCPKCKSKSIQKAGKSAHNKVMSALSSNSVIINAGTCQDCGAWFPWTARIKISIKSEKKKMWKVLQGELR